MLTRLLFIKSGLFSFLGVPKSGGSVLFPFPMTSGHGSPIGSVTPEARGHIYEDLDLGAAFIAYGLTSNDWMQFAGQQEQDASSSPLAAGVSTILHEPNGVIRGLSVIAPNGHNCSLVLTDLNAARGTGNGVYWTTNFDTAPDGAQECHAYTGDQGQFFTVIAAPDGTMRPASGIVFPTSDPHVAGAWWDNAGTLTRSSG